MSQSTVEVLEAALERLGPEGENWCQEPTTGPERFCMVGAFGPDWREAPEEAKLALAAVVGQPFQLLGNWNDHPDRTFDDVKAAFQTAIRAEKTKAAEHLTVPSPAPMKVVR